MSRILIHTLREHGHVLPTLKLARALVAAGHAVEHLLTPSWRGFAAEHAITIRTYLEDIFPEGSETAWAAMQPAARAADAERRGRARIAFLLAGGLDAVYRAAAPDLILGDVYDVSIPIVARRLGIPVVQLSPTLFQGREPGVPPLTSGAAWGDAAGAEAGWAAVAAARSAATDGYAEYVTALIDAYGFPRAELTWDGAIAPDLPRLAQLVLAPRALEFPRPLPSRCHDDVPSVTVRDELVAPALAAWLEGPPVVYCAFGSQGLWRPQYQRLRAQVFALAAARPDLRFVVSGGTEAEARLAGPAPGNVLAVAWAPQHAVLRRAAVMLAVGGLGSLKECLWHAVPMVLVPALNPFDGPGNAARVEHHGLGVALSPEALERELGPAIDRALAGAFTPAMQAMQAQMRAVEASDRGVLLVERALRGELRGGEG